MIIEVPNIVSVLNTMMSVKSKFNDQEETISYWIDESRNDLLKNKKLLTGGAKNDIKILIILYRDLLMRAMKGERSEHMTAAMTKHINSKSDLNKKTFEKIVSDCHYRWHKDGIQVMEDVADYFKLIDWDWTKYFELAEKHAVDNFLEDKLLKIGHIGYKVRDLAISNFNENFIAADIHIVRVTTRIGLMNYGYSFLPDSKFEMGNNPLDNKHYLFMHKLFWKLSKMTRGKYSLADIDRVFWHFGRTICQSTPQCKICPISKKCLTGKTK